MKKKKFFLWVVAAIKRVVWAAGGVGGGEGRVKAPAARITRSNPSEANCRDFPFVMATPGSHPICATYLLQATKRVISRNCQSSSAPSAHGRWLGGRSFSLS